MWSMPSLFERAYNTYCPFTIILCPNGAFHFNILHITFFSSVSVQLNHELNQHFYAAKVREALRIPESSDWSHHCSAQSPNTIHAGKCHGTYLMYPTPPTPLHTLPDPKPSVREKGLTERLFFLSKRMCQRGRGAGLVMISQSRLVTL